MSDRQDSAGIRIIRILIIIGTLYAIVYAISFFNCQVEMVCQLVINDGMGSNVVEFDCGIIYDRLGRYWDDSKSYVLGSMSNIETAACSYEVVGILRDQFGFGTNITACRYYCCVTDGTCYGFPPRGVNIQQMVLEVGS